MVCAGAVLGFAAVRADWLQAAWHAAASVGTSRAASDRSPWPVLDRYCAGCHNDDRLGRRHVVRRRSTAADVGAQRRRLGSRRPQAPHRADAAEGRAAPRSRRARRRLASWFERRLDAAWARAPNPGAKPLARLNRTEYANAIRDLLAYDAGPIAATLPQDVSVGGFRQHRGGARRVADAARGLRASGHADRPPRGRRSHDGSRRDSLRGGSRIRAAAAHRGTAARHARRARRRAQLPARRRIRDRRSGRAAVGRLGQSDRSPRVVRRPDRGPHVQRRAGRRSTSGATSGCASPRVRSGSPPRSSTSNACAGVNELYLGEVALEGGVTGLVIDGPYDATGAGDTPSRRAIFVCSPSRGGRAAVRAADPRAARDARVPAPRGSRRRRVNPLLEFYGAGARKAATSRSASSTRCRGCS